MPTASNSSTSYASATDMLTYHDLRQLEDLILDDGTRGSQSDFTSSTKVAAILKAAAAEIEAACFRGSRYTATELAALTGVGAELLKQLNVELAYWRLWVRRHPAKEMPPVCAWAYDFLERIKSGDLVFGLQEHVDAGLPDHDYLQQSDFDRRGEITDQASRGYFGIRAKIRRLGGGPFYGPGSDI